MLPARYAAVLSLPPFWQHWDRASLKDARQAPYHCSTARSVLVLKLLTLKEEDRLNSDSTGLGTA